MDNTIDESRITKIYVGADAACRCGCRGEYREAGTRAFKMALNKARKLSCDDRTSTYMNFPYGNNRAVTLYFD
jgi:hypothetical protein